MILMILMTSFSKSNVKFEQQQQQIDCWALLFPLLLCIQCILNKRVLLTVVEEIPRRDVDEVMFFRSVENEISSISVEKSLNMQNCQDMLWTDYYSQ